MRVSDMSGGHNQLIQAASAGSGLLSVAALTDGALGLVVFSVLEVIERAPRADAPPLLPRVLPQPALLLQHAVDSRLGDLRGDVVDALHPLRLPVLGLRVELSGAAGGVRYGEVMFLLLARAAGAGLRRGACERDLSLAHHAVALHEVAQLGVVEGDEALAPHGRALAALVEEARAALAHPRLLVDLPAIGRLAAVAAAYERFEDALAEEAHTHAESHRHLLLVTILFLAAKVEKKIVDR